MDNSAVTIIVAILSSSALSVLISEIFHVRQQKRRKDDGVIAGIRQLLYNQIKSLGRSYIARGWITTEELEDLIDTHKIYHSDLDGNGFLDSLMDTVKRLPIKDN